MNKEVQKLLCVLLTWIIGSAAMSPCSAYATFPQETQRVFKDVPHTTYGSKGGQLRSHFIWSGIDDGTSSFTVFRKSFETEKPQSAMICIFADVRYILWMNGKEVLRGPCRFDPKEPQYDSLDVADYLQKGKNSISVLVMSHGSNGKMMNHAPGLSVVLSMTSPTGTREVCTDESWLWNNRTRYLPPQQHWGFVCDRIDARLDDGDWTTVHYDDSGWARSVRINGSQWGRLIPRQIPLLGTYDVPARPLDGRSFPVDIAAGASVIIALDRMAQGYASIDFESQEGNRILFEAGYTTDSVQIASSDKAVNRYIARSKRQTYTTTDSYGFRFIRIVAQDQPVRLFGVKVTDRRYPYEDAGRFACSDTFLTELWNRAAHTIRMNAEDGYTDCALREKAEWMGDAAVVGYPVSRVLFGYAANGRTVKSDARLMKNMLRHIAQSQSDSGTLKAHHPSDRWDVHAFIEDYACLWIQSLRQVYDHTGDRGFVEEMWMPLKRQVQWFLDHRSANGLFHGREFVFVDNPVAYLFCEGATLNAFLYQALNDAAYLAQVMSDRESETVYASAAKKLEASFNKQLWIQDQQTYSAGLKDGKILLPTTHAALLALQSGIVPEERRRSVEEFIMRNYDNQDSPAKLKEEAQGQRVYNVRNEAFDSKNKANGINTPYTASWLLDFFYTTGHDTLALGYIRTKWAHMMRNNQTRTLTEGFRDGEQCHNFGAVPAHFLSAKVLGVTPLLPLRDKRIRIRPQLGDLQRAEGSVVTEHGVIDVGWFKTDNRIDFNVKIPEGISAEVYVPKTSARNTIVVNGKITPFSSNGKYLLIELGSGESKGAVY